jgi:hypothetical protein
MDALIAPTLIRLNRAKKHLTPQQYKTLRGQALAGNIEAALKGLKKIERRQVCGGTIRYHS